MSVFETNSQRATIESDSYELRASQEEFYLEETEEELRMILESDVTSSPSLKSPLPDPESEIEDLFTGDSDDPPLSEDQIEDALRRF